VTRDALLIFGGAEGWRKEDRSPEEKTFLHLKIKHDALVSGDQATRGFDGG